MTRPIDPPEHTTLNLAQQKSDFTAEGAPPPVNNPATLHLKPRRPTKPGSASTSTRRKKTSLKRPSSGRRP